MTTPTCPTASCDRPLHPATATVCEHCRHTIEVALVNIGYYHADLTTLRTGQVRLGNGGSVKARGDSHLGMDTRWGPTSRDGKLSRGTGDTLMHDTRNTITSWARYVTEHVSTDVQGPTCTICLHTSCNTIRKTRTPRDSVTDCCRYLLGWADWLRVSPAGHDALRDLTALEQRLARLVDRPPDRWYAGVCSAPLDDGECAEHLYAKAEAGDVKCPACGKVHDIGERRIVLLAAAENIHATTGDCARAITVWSEYDGGTGRLEARIRQWASRGRISMADRSVEEIDGRPRVLYRVGAVLDLLADDMRDNGARRVSA